MGESIAPTVKRPTAPGKSGNPSYLQVEGATVDGMGNARPEFTALVDRIGELEGQARPGQASALAHAPDPVSDTANGASRSGMRMGNPSRPTTP